MPRHIREVQRQTHQISSRITPAEISEQDRHDRVYQKEDQCRGTNAEKPVPIELEHRCPRLHRNKKERRCYHKERDAGSCNSTIPERNPESVGIISNPDHILPCFIIHYIEILRNMHHHHHETGNSTQIINEYDSSFHIVHHLDRQHP